MWLFGFQTGFAFLGTDTTIAYVTGEPFCILASFFALYDVMLLWFCDFVAVSFHGIMLTELSCSLQDASLKLSYPSSLLILRTYDTT